MSLLESLVNKDVQNIQISGIRKISNMVAAMQDVVSLTIGQPDFPTPAHILEAGKKAIDANKTVYTVNPGLIELRRAAAAFVEGKYELSYDPDKEIIVTAGASQALDITLRTILEPGNEVIMPGPIYPGYEPLVRLSGGVPVLVDTKDTGFKLTAELLEKAITPRTRCIVMCYPSNPTGRVMDAAELEAVGKLLKDKSIFVISDEIYSELIYDGPHRSIASFQGMRDKTIVINGLSKSHSMTGWRIGFTFAPAYLTQHMVKVHQYNLTCASSISQYAALEALTGGVNDAEPMKEAYRERRDFVHRRLAEIGLVTERPEGAFYIFPSIAQFGLSSMDFTMKMLEQEKVAVVPGDAFSSYGEGFIRISYAYSMDSLKEALNRLERFVQSLK
ncbi:aminotransferase A [Paenibacillus thalictri]|uniref:Aminotransferase n=1 Tax=Paenibacillus thalictri TaxID=2527873 RepID=A0A4Q9DS19_9BACL|nr:aminotransferase A [Paenibacillus thalictri]TBL78176.1 aminotransferase A [Paenibacillus thalictri]